MLEDLFHDTAAQADDRRDAGGGVRFVRNQGELDGANHSQNLRGSIDQYLLTWASNCM